ncbi:pentatricopeptide repeat-containing protein At1g76280 isoform X2 [Carica papaya]|nr:pentatricopeptide repeat-containing protein At1g76280 isoform X2 [Carica papaya]
MLPVYNIFLGACAKMNNIIHANKCLDLMERRMVGKNEVTYSELLKLAVWQQNLSAVHEIWKDYVKHYSMSIMSLRKFIWSFTRLGDLKSAYETLQHMVALAVRGRLFIRTNVEGKLCSSRLDIPIPSNGEVTLKEDSVVLKIDSHVEQCTVSSTQNGEIENARMCLLNKYKGMPMMKVLRWSFSDVIHACAQAQNGGLAEELMQQMQNIGLQPSSHTFDGFVRAIVRERGFSDGMKALKLMRQWNLKPYDPTLLTISIDCSRALELDLSEVLLDEISECYHPHAFNALLTACKAMDQPERAVHVFAKMKQLKLQPDIRTYELLFSLFGNVNAPYEEGNMLSQVDASKRINAIELDMAKNGLQHSHQSMKNLLKALGAEGMITELIQYLHVAEDLFCGDNTYLRMPIYKTVLHALVEAKESHKAVEIFKNMRAFGFPLDAAIYNVMIDCCSIIRCFKSACALVSVMIRNGFYPQTITYTTLTKILLEDENFDEAWNLLDQAISEGNQIDVVFYNTILQKACEKGRIDVIEFIVEQMHRDKVQPDPSTCECVFTAYVDQGFHSTAVEVLCVLSMRMLCKEASILQEKRTEFEDLILSEDLEAESRILQFFKDSEENLAIAMLNLRWCATVGFQIYWPPSESQWARRLLTNYDFRRGTTL